MVKDDSDPLDAWREAEEAYARAVTPFMRASGPAPLLRKKQLIELVELRGRADRWRERYFRHGHSSVAD